MRLPSRMGFSERTGCARLHDGYGDSFLLRHVDPIGEMRMSALPAQLRRPIPFFRRPWAGPVVAVARRAAAAQLQAAGILPALLVAPRAAASPAPCRERRRGPFQGKFCAQALGTLAPGVGTVPPCYGSRRPPHWSR